MEPFTLLIKPTGSDCNLDCTYCFYKHRSPEIGQGRQRMSDEVLEKLIRGYIELRLPESAFAWQGGEPTLMGLDFYKKAVELQYKFGVSGQRVSNSLQTNAILLDESWCRFLHEYKFLAGISIDGPKEMHDYYRTDHSRAGTFDKVIRAVECCKEHKVKFNTLTLLNDRNVEYPGLLYDFLVDLGADYIQFIPCVELDRTTRKAADFSITPQQYGDFMCRLFDRWYDRDLRKVVIRDFESLLAVCAGFEPTICTFDRRCEQYIVVEHSGDVFCCDFFVEPRWRLGNIMETPIAELVRSPTKRVFARAKQDVANKCLVCLHLAACRGGCLKDRAAFGVDTFGRESYFCRSYCMFFEHAMPRLMQLGANVAAALRASQ